jgi:hypothetical protein
MARQVGDIGNPVILILNMVTYQARIARISG